MFVAIATFFIYNIKSPKYSGIHFSCVAQQDFVHNTILVPRISTLFLVNYQLGAQTYHFVLMKYTSVS